MRKIYALLLALAATVALQAQTQDNAMYVYRNDGSFNAFLREDIDSIALSHFDLDSLQHNVPVCQVFYTPDSIYRIPIEAIDSVSFVQPETKYAPGVILLDEQYLPYIVEVTENTITFSLSTPDELLPKKGNVLAAMVFDEALADGFAGRIESETKTDKGVQFECSDVSIEDIYEQFVYTGKTIAADESSMSKVRKAQRRSSGLKTFNIETIHASSGPVSVDAHPTITVFYTINRNKNLKTHQSLIVISDIDVDVSLEAKVEVGEEPHFVWLPGSINIPTNVPGLYGFIRGGAFYKATAAASVTATCPGHIYWKFGFTNGDDGFNPIWNYDSNIQRPEFSVNMNGELDAGLCARIGFKVMSDKLASVYLTGYAGLYAKADFSLTDAGLQDGTLYSSLKDSQLEAGAYLCGEPGYTVMEQECAWRKEEEKGINLSLERRFPFRTWYLLPEFTEPKVKRATTQSSAVVQSTASRDLLMPVQLGLSIENDCGEVVDTKWCDEEYRLEKDWPSNALWKQFDNLQSGKTYTAYPCLRILNCDMKASPLKEVKFESQLVDITDFKVTMSQYRPNVFGSNSYRFDTSVTLTLKNSEDVEDWGYVYRYLNGEDTFVSLKSYGNTFTDIFYFYRNSAESTATLFGYVKYQGDNEYYFDEPQTFQLKHREEPFVDITDFKITSSQYQQDGFLYNGSTYSYKFDTSVTLTLKDSEGVEDWGYVCSDLDGIYRFISLKSHGNTFTDSHVYFRNNAESTVTLYGYVKYQGNPEDYCDDPQIFQLKYVVTDGEACVDANHVHKVDLGLSVKWACCNVGASSPEQYGGYYAWGETEEKSSYTAENSLTYGKSIDQLTSAGIIGSDGNLTAAYDVASVKLGGNWRMPTKAEFQELHYKCTWTWTTVNGVSGQKVTGPNGNSIFLPAACFCAGTSLIYEGNDGHYWSSSPYEDDSSRAGRQYFGSIGYGWGCHYRYCGLSVRPVSE